MKMEKSYYETDGNGSYFEFELEDGREGIINTKNGNKELPKEMKEMKIGEIISEFGEGKILQEPKIKNNKKI